MTTDLFGLIQEYRDTLKTGEKHKHPEIREKVMNLLYEESSKLSETLYQVINETKKIMTKGYRKREPESCSAYGKLINDFHNLAGSLASKKSINRVINSDITHGFPRTNILPPDFYKKSFNVLVEMINISFPFCIFLMQSHEIENYIKFLKIKESKIFSICRFTMVNHISFSIDEVPDRQILCCIIFKYDPVIYDFMQKIFEKDVVKYIKNIQPDDYDVGFCEKIIKYLDQRQ